MTSSASMVDFIHPQSALALVGAFADLLRERFSPAHALPWVYTGDPQTNTIQIMTQGDPETETASAAAKVVIRRGRMGYTPLSIGDHDHRTLPAHLTPGVDLSTYATTMSISMDIVDQRLGTAEIIADIIGAAVMGPRQALTRRLHLMSLGPVVIQPGQRYEEDVSKWLVSVQFPLQQEVTFLVRPLDTQVKEVRLNTQEAESATTATVYVPR